MGGTTGDGEPEAGIRASDAERDATVDRLSAATGDGRLTLEEFSQRMGQATTARTRAELDRLVADLPAETPPARPARRWPPGARPGRPGMSRQSAGCGSPGRGGWSRTRW